MITNGEHLPVEREDVIVVVAGSKAGIDFRRCPFGEVKPVQPAVAVIDQGLSVSSPVWCLQRIGHVVDRPAATAFDVEDFQITANVLAVRNEVFPGRHGNPHVAEYCLLDHILVV